MLPLVVKLHNTKSNTTDVFAFESSPVRIGRNKLNELHVHEDVVSQWHGLFRFGDGFVVFVDLGSTNGTMLNGQRIARNTEVPLAADSVLRIAHLEMRFARVAVPPAAITRKQSSFLAQPGDQSIAGARTVMFQAGALQAPRAREHRWVAPVRGHRFETRIDRGHALRVGADHVRINLQCSLEWWLDFAA